MVPTERIRHHLRAVPGASTRDVARALGVDDSTADYHLRRLQRRGAVSVEALGREKAWFNTGCGLCPVLRRAVPAFRRAPVAAVARALDGAPATAGALALRADLPVGAARWAIQSLEATGIAERTPTGRVRLREGAATCVRHAAPGTPCDLWGSCPVSRSLAGRLDPFDAEGFPRGR